MSVLVEVRKRLEETHTVSSDVRNQATGSPRPVLGWQRRTVKVDNFFTPI